MAAAKLLRNTKKTRSGLPRYTLRAHDSKGMRFCNKKKGAQIFETEIVNISETGLAFRVSTEHSPHIDDTIKVEFNVPGENYRIAWFADVVWMESPLNMGNRKKESVKVGIKFQEFPKRHQLILESGLQARFLEIRREERRQKMIEIINALPSAGMYLLVIAAFIGFFYFITHLSQNEDGQRPVQWGERFFKRVNERK